MSNLLISRDEVIERSDTLPAFPSVISQILETIEDVDANLNMLIEYIQHDPVITSRTLAFANGVASRTKIQRKVSDIYTATSLIGMSAIRNIALTSSLANFCEAEQKVHADFVRHSISVGVCCEELVSHTEVNTPPATALISGLLHDIGQFWLCRFKRDEFLALVTTAKTRGISIEQAEKEHFGVDHGMIGAWMATHWSLPPDVCSAIEHHHSLATVKPTLLEYLLHVAEVLGNALELPGKGDNQVTHISSQACGHLKLTWDASSRQLFGRIEARSRYSTSFIN